MDSGGRQPQSRSGFLENYYLCLKKDTQGKPLTRIYPISHNAASGSDDRNDNDRRLPQNVNKKWNNFCQSDFICYGTDDTEYPLYDVMIKPSPAAPPTSRIALLRRYGAQCR